MSLDFSFLQYNIGANVNDYFVQCRYHGASQPKTQDDQDQFVLKYDRVQEKTAALLKDRAEVYCFQEVYDVEDVIDEDGKKTGKTRPMIRELKDKKFEIVYKGSNPDAVIALDTSRFKDIENHSIEKGVAIAVATDRKTDKRYTFVSAHVPGLDLVNPSLADAKDGDKCCKDIAKKLAEVGQGTIQVIGADMNANPERWSPRFETFTEKGFDVHRTYRATNVNVRDTKYRAREIDFVFIKYLPMSFLEKIKSIFTSIFFRKCETAIGFKTEINASDHLPVVMRSVGLFPEQAYEYKSLI